MNRPEYDYIAYGLYVRSSVALPFMPLPPPPGRASDVTVRVGVTPARLSVHSDERNQWQAAPDAFLMNVPGVARYLVTGGRDILVEPRGGNDHDVGIYLVGSVFAALLQQRGVATLHASAIATPAGAVLFAGKSGSGKSSLLATFIERGYTMLADDVTGVVLDAEGRPTVLSAFPSMRLWADTLDKLGSRHRRDEKVQEGLEKYVIPVERFRAEPLALRAVFVLTSYNRESIEVKMAPAGAGFRWLWRFTYRKRFLHGLGQHPVYFRVVVETARRVPVVHVKRPVYPYLLGPLADRIDGFLWDGEGACTLT